MREWERCEERSRSSSSSVSLVEGAGILPSLREREHPLHIQIFAVVAGLCDHQAGEIQPQALLDVCRIDVMSGFGDLECELARRPKDARPATVHLYIDAEPLTPFAIHLAD